MFRTVILFSLLLTACGRGTFNVENETDRLAMKIDIRNALTSNNCTEALTLSTQLYQSAYSDNDTRMLYASAHACNVGIRLYDLIDKLTASDFSSPDQIFKSMVRIFPSRTTDTRLQSGWFAQDALQAILRPGAVIGAVDQIYPGTKNPGSLLVRDRTDDANLYLTFIAMSELGTTLNRFGYLGGQDPAAGGYAQIDSLTWVTRAAVTGDTSNTGCGVASSVLNMLDGIRALVAIVAGSTSAALDQILVQLDTVSNTAATTQCTTDGGSAAACEAAVKRLRFRASCSESNDIASAAAGIVTAINLGWQ